MADAEAPSLDAWRQGSILPSELAIRLGLLTHEEAGENHVVVISHDCDIANSRLGAEPHVEVIRAKKAPKPDGNMTAGKSPRRLHLEWDCAGTPLVLDLAATGKLLLPKNDLQGHDPDPAYTLGESGRRTLRYWLAVRYNRAALPDEFNDRLSRTKVLADIQKAIAACPHITAVYLRLNTDAELAADDPAPYEVDLVLAFSPGVDPEESQDTADKASEAIESAFERRCRDSERGAWRALHLKSCLAISEDDMTVSQAKRLQQLHLDHVSLRTDPQGPTALGVIP